MIRACAVWGVGCGDLGIYWIPCFKNRVSSIHGKQFVCFLIQFTVILHLKSPRTIPSATLSFIFLVDLELVR